jgi:HAD superfamily hydrolase (TIGR01509 family)
MINKRKTGKTFFLLFDLDGTLVDTDAIHVACYRKVGVEDEDLAKKLRQGELHVTPEQKKQKAIYVEEMCKRDGVQWMPGAEELLSYCFSQNIQFCIVTNTPRKPVEAMCSQLPLLHKANEQKRLLCREDYSLGKPHPDGYQLALERFYEKEDCILGFENTYIGWCALQALGLPNLQVYFVVAGGQEDKEEVREKGGLCISSLKVITEDA